MQTFAGRRLLVGWVSVAALYLVIAAGTIHLASDGRTLSTVWAADAALLAILLWRPWSSLLPVLSAGFAGNVLANVLTRGWLPEIPLYAIANMVAVAVAGVLLRRRLGQAALLGSPASVGFFILVAGVIAPALSALPGAVAAWLGGHHPFGSAFAIWFLADALGLTVFTPVFVAMLRGEFARAVAVSDARTRTEVVALLLFTLLASLFVFFVMEKAVLFILFAPVTLVTFRNGRLGLKAAVTIVAVVGMAATLSGAGPITRLTADPIEQAMLMQAFLATLLLCSLPAAAALEAQRRAIAALGERQKLLERREAELSVLAEIDSLTGLLNRGAFRARVEQVLADGAAPACLLAIDLDRFKQVNDRFGHPAGDAALVHVSRLLERHLRPADIVGRLGGDEFMVFLPGITAASADLVVRRLQAALSAAPLPLDEELVLPLAMSVGVAERCGAASLDVMAAEADAALYRGKFAGRRAA